MLPYPSNLSVGSILEPTDPCRPAAFRNFKSTEKFAGVVKDLNRRIGLRLP
jgi:hypothetical protein